jgi:Peptidase MA superfamily
MPASEGFDGTVATQVLFTPRFRIIHTARATGAALVLQRDLEAIADDIGKTLGRDWSGITEVRVGFGKEEYEALALPGAKPPSWAVALAYPAHNIVLVEAHALVNGEGPLTLRHELVHVALGQFGHDWPHWFQEGFAQAFTHERAWQLEQIATLTRAVTQERVFDFDDLTAHFPSRPEDVEIAYAQSVAFVEFLRDRHGATAFSRLIAREQGGDNFDKAFGVTFGVPLSMEEAAFKEELPRRYPWWPLLLSGGSLVWLTSAGLMVLAFVKRRRVVLALRAEQLRLEVLHEAAKALLAARPANDLPVPDFEYWPYEGTPMPWVVNIVRFVPALEVQPNSSATHLSADG